MKLRTEISLPGAPLWRAYRDLNRHAWSSRCPVVRANDKMFFHGIVPIHPWRLFGFQGFTMYTKAKIGQLLRNYIPPDQIELARERIRSRMARKGRIDQFMSVGIRIGTGLKDKVKKTGECISGMTFHLFPAKYASGQQVVDLQVFFRVSEITQRLLGDFMLIDYVIRKVLGPIGYIDSLGTVTLYLASYYALVPEFLFWARMYPPAFDELDIKKDGFGEAHWERMISIIKTGINPKSGTKTNYLSFQKKKRRVDMLAKMPSLYLPNGELRPEYEDYKGPLEP